MTAAPSDPRARVAALLAGARRAFGAGRPDRRVGDLAAEAGLAPAVVADALDRWLELAPLETELTALLARARPAPAALVVLSANVPTAPLRAIAWALAAAPVVAVRTSRRARVFVETLAHEVPGLFAHEVVDGHADLAARVATLAPDAVVHVYGGADAVAAITAAAGARRCEAHGPGFGAVYLDEIPSRETARAVADDVAAFDQRGCLSPRILLVRGDARTTAERVSLALDAVGARLPRAPLDAALRAAIARLADAAAMVGAAHVGPHHAVFCLGDGPPTVSPGGRTLTVHAVPDRAAAEGVLAALGPSLTVVASDVPLAVPRGLRTAAPGAVQRPPFDGPVDLRPLLVLEERE